MITTCIASISHIYDLIFVTIKGIFYHINTCFVLYFPCL